jgi:hypothetical protein
MSTRLSVDSANGDEQPRAKVHCCEGKQWVYMEIENQADSHRFRTDGHRFPFQRRGT